MTDKIQTCTTCMFSRKTRQADVRGDTLLMCHRYPPVIFHGEMGMMLEQSAWPTVRHNALCGEWSEDKDASN